MRPLIVAASAALAAGGILYGVLNRQAAVPVGLEVARPSSARSFAWREPETSAGLCPWRAADEDRRRFFPMSTGFRDETLILSRQRLELEKRLGRMPGADDNALIVHRIIGMQASPGFVVTRRIRGECGLIELVLATDEHGRVIGARIQRHREPEQTARVFQSTAWLGAFRGKDSRSAWQVGEDIPAVPAAARVSADAIAREARTVLILLDVAIHSDSALPPGGADSEHHHG
jgi:hypothetical protein